MNKKVLFLAAMLISVSVFADTDKVSRTRPILAVNSTTRTTGTSLVTSDSLTNEYSFITFDTTPTGVSSATTLTFARPFLVTPTMLMTGPRPFVDRTFSGTLYSLTVNNALFSVTTLAATASGVNSTTLGNVKFLIYGTTRAGVLE